MIKTWIHITARSLRINNKEVYTGSQGAPFLTELYRKYINNYPKFFKMDTLCRLGFVASEILLEEEKDDLDRFTEREDRAIVLFNRSSSLHTDRNFQQTIQDPDNYYPSPSVFVYTLPNITTGEIAIRNKFYGETSFYVIEDFNPEIMAYHISNVFRDGDMTSVLGGWLNCESDEDFEAFLFLARKEIETTTLEEEIKTICKQLNR